MDGERENLKPLAEIFSLPVFDGGMLRGTGNSLLLQQNLVDKRVISL